MWLYRFVLQDAEYEYFEQRQLPPRPLPGPALQPLLNQVSRNSDVAFFLLPHER